MADYPDWVLKHKKKGAYINFVKGRYYLYAAHSERVPGTKKVRRVSDGYIGRITEEGGLIPSRDKVAGEVPVYELGLCSAALSLCGDAFAGFAREFRGAADFVSVSAILWAVYGRRDRETFSRSYLCALHPSLDMGRAPTPKQETAILRGRRMVSDMLAREFGDALEDALRLLSGIFMVKINGRFYRSQISCGAGALLAAHGIRLEG
jgi:hypothetical protein